MNELTKMSRESRRMTRIEREIRYSWRVTMVRIWLHRQKEAITGWSIRKEWALLAQSWRLGWFERAMIVVIAVTVALSLFLALHGVGLGWFVLVEIVGVAMMMRESCKLSLTLKSRK